MARIINAKEILQQYAAGHPELEMSIALTDQQLSTNSGYYYLNNGKCMSSAKRLPGRHLALTIGELCRENIIAITPLYESNAKLAGYNPLKSTPSNTKEGIRQDEDIRASLPTAAKEAQSVIILPVTFISLIGWVSLAVFNQESLNAIRKSPELLLQLPPLKPVTKIPFCTSATKPFRSLLPGLSTNRRRINGRLHSHFLGIIGIDKVSLQHPVFKHRTRFCCHSLTVEIACSPCTDQVRFIHKVQQLRTYFRIQFIQ